MAAAPELRDAAGRKAVVCPACHGRGLAVEREEVVDRPGTFWMLAQRRLRPCEVCRGSGVVAWVRETP